MTGPGWSGARVVDDDPNHRVVYLLSLPPALDEWLTGQADRTGSTPTKVLRRLVEQAAADQ